MAAKNSKNDVAAINGISHTKSNKREVKEEELNNSDDYCVAVAPLTPPALVTRVEEIYTPPTDSTDPPVILEMQTLKVSLTKNANNSEHKEHNKEFVEGVKIEGEGEYQIIEVDDADEEDIIEEKANTGNKREKEKIKSEMSKRAPTPKTNVSIVKAPNVSSAKLTREEERAVALEQMELLKAALNTRKSTRKTEKQNKYEKEVESKADAKRKADQDLLKTLSADWSDDEDDDQAYKETKIKAKSVTSVKKEVEEAEVPLKCRPISRRRPVTIPPGIALQATEASTSGDAASGFKRRRVIKRRIIWDPDVPETHLSFAEFARTSNTVNTVVKNSIVELNIESDEDVGKKIKKTEVKAVDKKKETQTRLAKSALKINDTQKVIKTASTSLAPIQRQQRSSVTKNTTTLAKEPHQLKSGTYVKSQKGMKNNMEGESSSKKANVPGTSEASCWDYVYNDSKMQALIVRRHSSSSLSSCEFEGDKPEPSAGKTVFQEDKKPRKSQKPSVETKYIIPKQISNCFNGDLKHFSKYTYRNSIIHDLKLDGGVYLACLDYTFPRPIDHPRSYRINAKVISKLAKYITAFNASEKYKIFVLWSKARNFCCGIDYCGLMHDKEDVRKDEGRQLREAIKDLFHALGTCVKPLIVGVNGKVEGLGLTMLAFFDIIIAKDDTVFCSSRHKMVGLPEGYGYWTKFSKINDYVLKRLFYLGDFVPVNELYPGCFVHKICHDKNFAEVMERAIKRMYENDPRIYLEIKKNQRDIFMSIDEEEACGTQEEWNKTEFIENLREIDLDAH